MVAYIPDTKDVGVLRSLDKINNIIKDKPIEALSMAKKLLEQYNDDDDVILLCLKTAIKSQQISHKSLIDNDLINIGKKSARKNFLVPDIISSYVIALALNGQKIKNEDVKFLMRAMQMKPEKTKKIIKDIINNVENKHNKKILLSLCHENN